VTRVLFVPDRFAEIDLLRGCRGTGKGAGPAADHGSGRDAHGTAYQADACSCRGSGRGATLHALLLIIPACREQEKSRQQTKSRREFHGNTFELLTRFPGAPEFRPSKFPRWSVVPEKAFGSDIGRSSSTAFRTTTRRQGLPVCTRCSWATVYEIKWISRSAAYPFVNHSDGWFGSGTLSGMNVANR
jgi:hypothetical protein